MPALVAARFNPDLKTKYQQLIAAGKSPKVAITAIMRKLAILANVLLKKGKNWEEKSACASRILWDRIVGSLSAHSRLTSSRSG